MILFFYMWVRPVMASMYFICVFVLPDGAFMFIFIHFAFLFGSTFSCQLPLFNWVLGACFMGAFAKGVGDDRVRLVLRS